MSTSPQEVFEEESEEVQYQLSNDVENETGDEQILDYNTNVCYEYNTLDVVKRRGNLPKVAINIMRCWLQQHRFNPYPTDAEKVIIAKQTNLTLLQVNNWMINARRRILPEMLGKEGHDSRQFTIKRRRRLSIDGGGIDGSTPPRIKKLHSIGNLGGGTAIGRPIRIQSGTGSKVVIAKPYTGDKLLVVKSASGKNIILRVVQDKGANSTPKAYMLRKATVVQHIGNEAVVKMEAPMPSVSDEAFDNEQSYDVDNGEEEEIQYYEDVDSADSMEDHTISVAEDEEEIQVYDSCEAVKDEDEDGTTVEYTEEEVTIEDNVNEVTIDDDTTVAATIATEDSSEENTVDSEQ